MIIPPMSSNTKAAVGGFELGTGGAELLVC
jgi:hypothetical protein